MAREVQAIHARFTGDTRDLDQAVRRANSRMGDFRDRVKRASARIGDLGAAAGVATGAIALVGRQILQTADAIGKTAKAAGVTTGQVQELRFAFGQVAGTTDRQVDQALQRFNRSLGLARDGSAEYLDVLERLGVNLSQKTPQALEQTLQQLAQIEDDADRAAAAAILFGDRAGPRLAGALKGGTQAVDALRKRINDEGGVFGEEQIKSAEAFNDQMDLLSKTVTADLANTMLENSDALMDLAEALASVASAGIGALASLSDVGSFIGTKLAHLIHGDPLEGLEQLNNGIREIDLSTLPSRRDLPAPETGGAAGGGGDSGSGGGIEELTGLRIPGMRGSGEGLEDLRDRMREESEARLQELQRRYATEEELLAEKKARDLETIRLAIENQQLVEDEGRALVEEIEQEHMERLAEIRARGMKEIASETEKSFREQASTAARYLSNMTANVAQQNRAMFEINKAAALSAAALDAREAVTGAYKVGARIGGPPLGAAFAAAAGASQAANIAAIASTSYGGATAPSVGPTAAPPVQAVNGGGANSGGNGGGQAGPDRTLTVRGLSPDALFDGESVRTLAEQLIEFQRDGGRVLLQE